MKVLQSIRSKIVTFGILATLLPSLGLGLMSFRYSHIVIDERVAHELGVLSGHARRELDLWIQERTRDLRSLSTSALVIDGLAAAAARGAGAAESRADIGLGGNAGLTLYLRSVCARLTPLLALDLVDADGRFIAGSADLAVPSRVPEPWPRDALAAGAVLMPPHWDATHGAPTLSVAVPVLSIDNELLGALVAVLDLRAALANGGPVVQRAPSELLLLDMQGRVLVGARTASGQPPALPAVTLQQLRERAGQPLEVQSVDQRAVIAVADPLGAASLIIVAQQDVAASYAAWRDLRDRLLLLVGAMTLLAALLGWRMGRSIITPLRRLIGAAERVADGDLAVELPAARDDEVGRLTRAFNRMIGSLRRGRAEIDAASRTLQSQNRLLERLSVTDALTGLYNRRKLDEVLADQIARYQRNLRPFSVLMLDIDHFKQLNDRHGHQLGDEVLVQVAQILARSIRHVDFAARYGGEEFAIVLIDTAATEAMETAERIRKTVAAARFGAPAAGITVTASIGIAQCRDDDVTAEAVVARADAALYRSKDAGRDRVLCAVD